VAFSVGAPVAAQAARVKKLGAEMLRFIRARLADTVTVPAWALIGLIAVSFYFWARVTFGF
jgi:hypothetical protein